MSEQETDRWGPTLHGISLELLSAYVDGDVSGEERAEVEAALARAPELAIELEEMRQLAQHAGALPRTGPPRDLWPEIRARVLAPPWWKQAWVLARAPGLVAVGALAAILVMARLPASQPEVVGEPASIAAARGAYREAIVELEAQTLARVRELPETTRAALERSLAEVDAAIRDAERALNEAPSDAFAHRVLLALYDEKLRVMQAVLQQGEGSG